MMNYTDSDVPATMRASVLSGPRTMVMEDRPVPRPGPEDVLVQVRSVGVCGSDVHYYDHGRIGDFVVRAPLVLGHEVSGVVVAVGEQVDPARVGTRVAVEPGTPCGRCGMCKRGAYNLCSRMRFYATPPIDGAFSEFVLARGDLAFDLPASVSDEAAALLEPLSVGIWANYKASVGAGSSVLIAGAGPIGLVTAQVAAVSGATDVVVSDISAQRLEVALAMGATAVVDAAAGAAYPGEFDVFVDCSGAPAAIASGIEALRPAGAAVLVGMGPQDITLPFARIQQRELTVTGTFRYANTWPTAIALAASGRVRLDAMVTGKFGLAETEQALSGAAAPGSIKSIIEPWR